MQRAPFTNNKKIFAWYGLINCSTRMTWSAFLVSDKGKTSILFPLVIIIITLVYFGYIKKAKKKKIIWITGRSAAGKTTLGENFKTLPDFIHFDADQFSAGNDPINDSGKTIEKRHLAKRSKQLVDAYDNLAVTQGYGALFENKKPDLSVWRPFYDLLLKEIHKIRMEYCDKNIVVTQSVYPSSVRHYLRSVLKQDLIFIILNTSTELLPQRMITRSHERAQEIGQTADEYLQTFGSSLEEIENVTAPLIQKGFEAMHDDEPDTFQIDIDANMTKQNVFDEAKRLLTL